MMPLEDRFVRAIEDLDLPEVDLVDAVLAEVAARPAGRERRGFRPFARPARPWSAPPRLAWALAAALLVATAAVLFVEPARTTVANWFGIGATRVDTDPAVPPVTTDSAPTGSDPAPAPATAALGTPVEITADPIPLLGPPTAAYDRPVARGRAYTWPADGDRPALPGSDIGTLLSVRSVDGPIDVKTVLHDDVRVVVVDVDGVPVPALWLDGTHELLAAGAAEPVLAERVLLWQVGGVQYRLESELELTEALRLAAAVEGGTGLLQPG